MSFRWEGEREGGGRGQKTNGTSRAGRQLMIWLFRTVEASNLSVLFDGVEGILGSTCCVGHGESERKKVIV